MRNEPDPAVSYPEVAAHGSLAAALQVAAADQGMSLAMVATASDPLRHATTASVRNGWNGPALAQVATPAEAISIAVDKLPEGLGQGDQPAHEPD
jgi:hypothetical protein